VRDFKMPFVKKSISMTQPTPVSLGEGREVSVPGFQEAPRVGEEKQGKVWDGEKWIPKAEWDLLQASR
jgi:hypothetical protein